MMKGVLEDHFGKHYGSTKRAHVTCRICHGEFSFADAKACADCKIHTPGNEAVCDKVVWKCNSSETEVEVLRLEEFIDNFSRLKAIPSGRKCDLLLVSNDKIVFCEMTCCQAKFIEPFEMKDGTPKIGKRNMVRKQLENSITLLVGVPEIFDEIKSKSDKEALFAYREKRKSMDDEVDSLASERMHSFNVDISKTMGEPMYADMSNGFVLAEIRYPDTYIWGDEK